MTTSSKQVTAQRSGSHSRLFEEPFAITDRYLPGLIGELNSIPMHELESPGNPGIPKAKQSGASKLLIPRDYEGLGATAPDVMAVQFTLGSVAPSTAVALTMHQFTAATLVELIREEPAMEWIVLEAAAREQLLVASAFAEGRPDGKILSPTMTLTADGSNFRLSGVKRPCSLTASMDLITVSVNMPPPSEEFAVALIPASEDGIRIEKCWSSPVLAGAETAAVVFDEVFVPRAALSYVGTAKEMDRPQIRAYAWFQLCITAAYLGIAAGLVERVMSSGRSDAAKTVDMATEIEGARSMLADVARRLEEGDVSDALLSRALLVRYATERSINRATDTAFELLGVAALADDPVVGLLLPTSRALSYHPPSKRRCEGALAAYMHGEDLVLD
jgi:alkylation response protein AidB-like acyl-CoA dehydrogenase